MALKPKHPAIETYAYLGKQAPALLRPYLKEVMVLALATLTPYRTVVSSYAVLKK